MSAPHDAGNARRRAVAVAAGAAGIVDLALAAVHEPPFRAGPIAVDWAVAAVLGARYVLLVAGIVLVLVTRGLLHGKRNAWLLAVAAALAALPGHHVKHADLVGLVSSSVLLAVLIVTRSAFRARSDPALARRGLQVLVLGELVTFGYGVAGLYWLDHDFRREATFAESAREAVRLLLLLPTAAVVPVTRHGRWFLDSVRLAAMLVVFTALVRLVASVVGRPSHRGDEAAVRSLLDGCADSSLAHFTLLDDKAWFFSEDRTSFIGYKVVGTTALALGGPVGPPESRGQAIAQFVQFCSMNGWTPAFHQVRDVDRADLEAAGLRLLKIGEEALIPVQGWSLDAPGNKSLRSALRRVERAGCRVVELPRPIDDARMAQLRAVSDAWLAAGGHRERTFTLGQFDAAYLRETTVIAVVNEHDRVVAFANVLPAYRSADGNFDLMRRDPGAPNGVMEALFVALIERFRSEGRTGMSLGLAPAANITGDTLADRALRFLYDHGGQAFHFGGLRSFKDKWHPEWEPRYLAYRRDTELPKVAAAVARAGELPDPRSLAGRVRRVLGTVPFTLALASAVFWLMAATATDGRTYRTIVRHLGLSWHDLVHLQLWRLPTSQLIQTRPGFVWSNLALLLLVVPLAEWRLGSRRTISVFFLADWCSTLPILVVLRLAGALGSATAAADAATRDGGLSSGAWALAAVIALSLPWTRVRRGALAAIAVWLVGSLAWYHRLFDAQHLLAAAIAVALVSGGTAWRTRRARGADGHDTPAPPTEPAAERRPVAV